MNTLPNYDASFCGKLPLHQTNLIQPHGVLFVLEPATLQVQQVSDNVPDLLGLEAPAVAGAAFNTFLAPASQARMAALAASLQGTKQPLELELITPSGAVTCSARVHDGAGMLLLEVLLPELVPTGNRSFLDVYQELRFFLRDLQACATIPEFAGVVARELRRLGGFDKVLVYSFNEEWHGTVIAEEKDPAMSAYLGLRFPASDIPRPARELYLKNPYRFIANGGYQPARLYPMLHPVTHALTDLSGCDLRSVAAVHLEYMRNMEISASLSLRLVHEGRLWGLVSCHHRTPRYCSFETLGLFELLSEISSTQLSILVGKEASERKNKLHEQLTALVPQLHEATNLQAALEDHAADVQQLLGAGGVAFNVNGHVAVAGQVPGALDIDRLFYWLEVQLPQTLVHQPALPQVFEEAEGFADRGSGMLALPVVPEKGQFVVAFRPEAVEEVAWGGNPHEALQIEADGRTYHPRNSFSIWKQTLRHQARPWTTEELEVAEAFRNVLTTIALKQLHG